MPTYSNPRVRLGIASLLLLVALAFTSCGLVPGTQTQGDGLPTLHRLDWGFAYYDAAVWSPNGKWIATLAGSDYATSHLEVVSPDGRFKQDLTSWACGEASLFSIAWLPDSSLSCFNDTSLITGSFPFSSRQVTRVSPALVPDDIGGTWSPDGSILIMASFLTPNDPTKTLHEGVLYAVTRDGRVSPEALSSSSQAIKTPAWMPGGSTLAYLVITDLDAGTANLVRSPVIRTTSGMVRLGPAETVAEDVDQYYSWAPSGHWIAVRHADYRGGDKIYLVNPDDPSQTVDVVLADKVGQQMMNPIWSPDGKTLIVFSVGYNSSQPYELDIAAYLHSKGLEP